MSPADPEKVRDTILRAVAQRPRIGQVELASRVATATRAPKSAVVAAIRELEREGMLASSRVERRKVYELPAASPLELARRVEIEQIVAATAGAESPPSPPPEVSPPPPAATVPPAPAEPLSPVAPARRAIPAWGWALVALVALAWNALIFRLLAGD